VLDGWEKIYHADVAYEEVWKRQRDARHIFPHLVPYLGWSLRAKPPLDGMSKAVYTANRLKGLNAPQFPEKTGGSSGG